MELCQKLMLSAHGELITGLWASCPDNSYEKLIGPCRLSFHPYALEAWGKIKYTNININTKILWEISIIDDEEHKALFRNLSPSRCLLLLSETIRGLYEGASSVDLSVLSLIPQVRDNILSLTLAPASPESSPKKIIGAMLVLRTALDSLLFSRGLMIKSSTVTLSPRSEELEQTLAFFL